MNIPLQGPGGRLSCLHTHTSFCDGADDVETMCRAAFEKGLWAIGFSAHGPIFNKTGIKTGWHLPDERLGEYIEEVQAVRRRWEGKLAVFCGIEIDYIKGLRCALDDDIKALNLDYLIGSVHYVFPPGGSEPFTVDGPPEEFEKGLREGFNNDGEALMHAYYDAVAEMIALGGFDILGHADLVKKNNGGSPGRYFNVESEAYRQRCAEIAQAAGPVCGRACMVVEVNTGGLNRGRISETYPSLSFLRLFREQGVPALITSDAHCAEHVDGHYDLARRVLAATGYVP